MCRHVDDANSGQLRGELESLQGRDLEERMTWFGLLSAIVAMGVQYSDLRREQRVPMVHEHGIVNALAYLGSR